MSSNRKPQNLKQRFKPGIFYNRSHYMRVFSERKVGDSCLPNSRLDR